MQALLTKLSFYLSIALKFLILYFLFRRDLRRRFFWFLVYIAYAIIESGLRLSVSGNTELYYSVFWWTEIGDVSLMVLAFSESFMNVFRTYTRLRWFVVFIWCCIGVGLLYALFKALVFPPLNVTVRGGKIIIDLGVAINFALGIVAILYFALTALLRIKEYRLESGIISGFTIYVALSICGSLIRSIYGKRFPLVYGWLAPIGYLLAELTWAFELGRPERALVPTRELTVDDLTKLDEYSRFLERLLGRKA